MRTYTRDFSVTEEWRFSSLDIGVPSPMEYSPGAKVPLSASVSGNASGLSYKFVWQKDNWAKMGVIQDLSSSPSCEWSPAESGDYTLYVDVVDGNGEVETRTVEYKAWCFEGVSLSLQTTFSGSVGRSVTIAPDMGCTVPQGLSYKYTWMLDGWERWGVIAGPTSSTSATWSPTGGPRTYAFVVDVIAPDGTVETRTEYLWIGSAREILSVPLLYQNPELPTGCESVALTMALSYYGFPLLKTTIADNYLTYSSQDFVDSFMGNPRLRTGLAVMAPGIRQAADRYLMRQGSSMRAFDITGSTFGEVLQSVAQGTPVIIWNTMYMEWPSYPMMSQYAYGRIYNMYPNTHTVVVSGFDYELNKVLVNDSLSGLVWRDASEFSAVYAQMGSQAVVIR